MSNSKTILIAGASGYIGRSLISKLLDKYPDCQITALSRSQQKSSDPRVQWKSCDLFSLKSLKQAIPDQIDIAFYLVHSMGPTAQLDQGSFEDFDLILADNFSRAVKSKNLKQVIYLGGLVPSDSKLSKHLASRLEMEQTFIAHGLPLTVFRAGLIVGEEGTSFQILLKLVDRLPIMICPQWTRTLTSPIDLDSVILALADSAGRFETVGKIYDLAGCGPLPYVEMMLETARSMGLKRRFYSVPFFTPTLSRLWVSLVSNSPKNLVYPLIESLEHPMGARSTHAYPGVRLKASYFELLEQVKLVIQPRTRLFRFRAERKTVRSVQRMVLPAKENAESIAKQYFEWLPRILFPFVQVSHSGAKVMLSFLFRKWVLLELELMNSISDSDYQLISIRRGLLVGRGNRGELEFRVALNRQIALSAIHDFRPALPWFVYKYTQAIIHLWVMKAFARSF